MMTLSVNYPGMRQIAQTKHVRIDPEVLKRLKALSQKTGMSSAEIASLCIDDCIRAYEAKKGIVPRILLIMQVIESGVRFDEPDSRTDKRKTG
jgi:hypothetical protein